MNLAKQNDTSVHVVIPDTQVKPGVPDVHLEWIGRYIADQFGDRKNVTVIHLGDHWDMPSLSSYDKGKKAMEGRRYLEDIAAGNEAFARLDAPLSEFNKGKRKPWLPRKVLLLGNHEDRISRACEADAQLDGLLSLDDLNAEKLGWEVIPFLQPIFIGDIGYCHYWQNTMTGKPMGGTALTRLKNLGHSFTMGHQQTLDYAVRFVRGKSQHALIAGACYLHDEDYKGYQGNAHWRGIIVAHEVNNGSYDPLFVSLDYLCRRYTGMTLERFRKKNVRHLKVVGW